MSPTNIQTNTMVDFKNPPYTYVTTPEELSKAVSDLENRKEIAVDVEATGTDPYLAKLIFVQLGTPEKAYIIDADLDLKLVKSLLEDKAILKILQNGKFDYGMLKTKKNMQINNFYDTMLAERILTTGKRQAINLGVIAEKYLDVKLDKDWELYDWKSVAITKNFDKRHFNYSALDVLVLFPIQKKQFEKLSELKLLKIASLEFALAPIVSEMELRGIGIDEKKWRENIQDMREKRDEIAEKIQNEFRPLFKHEAIDLFGNHQDVVNLNSPSQLIDAFAKLGVDLPSTGSAVLKRVDHPLAKMLLEYRGYEKLISSFGETLLEKIHPVTGRIHCDFMQIGADTGRFASSNPNLQQIPSDSTFRGAFKPTEGFKFVTGDYSQAELRIMAELSGDDNFMDAYLHDKDLHTLTAAQMYGIPQEEVRQDVERFQAKSINFGLMYGRGAASLATQLGISVQESRRLLNKYLRTYKGVKKWLDKAADEAVRNGYSRTLGGRIRYYQKPDKADTNYERKIAHIRRQGKNTPIQGTSADMTKYAIVFTARRLKEENYDTYIVHTVHDEIVVEAREEQAEQVRKVMAEEMERAGRLLLKRVPIKVDVSASDRWEH